ncbi:porin family protein [Segetibacter koreensis]|uniref:porin family protein n=1 Tax=Segetibacter koreensis TaxID=398037 RepID=UPI0003762243|nr:porin family protein [Segetibacter koreensis]
MKKIIASAILLIALAGVANAQTFSIGGKAGANLTKITGKAFKEEYNLGYQLGIFAEIDLSKKWGIQPELLWNQVNTHRASGTNPILNNWQDSTGTIQLRYLTIPILLRYNIGNLVTLHLGPQFGILSSKDKTLWNNSKEAFKSGDFSMVGGLQLNLKTFRVYGRYVVGLSNINDVGNQDKWKSQQLQVGVGIRL